MHHAAVIATITYQPALSPPNGVWLTQACLNTTCDARTLVLGSHVNYHNLFPSFLVSNSIAFTASLSVIFLLIGRFPLKNKIFYSHLDTYHVYHSHILGHYLCTGIHLDDPKKG